MSRRLTVSGAWTVSLSQSGRRWQLVPADGWSLVNAPRCLRDVCGCQYATKRAAMQALSACGEVRS